MRPRAVLDLEVYTNYFLIAMKDLATGNVVTIEHPFDADRVRRLLRTYQVVTFNGTGYDIPILMYALTGATTQDIKRASNRIITHNLKPWNFAREFDVELDDPALNHIDLMDVAPLKGSLKMYGGRMHSKYLQALPYHHETILRDEEKEVVRLYCINDLQLTEDLHNSLKVQLELRQSMSTAYGINLMSKSDAQIAEAVVKSEIERMTHSRMDKPGCHPGQRFHYNIPSWMSFFAIDILDDIRKAEFIVNDKGSVLMPPELAKRKIVLKDGIYRMGIGGLHSSEANVSYHADADHVLLDRDVTSYYPAILLNQGLFPQHIGPNFTTVYRKLVTQRLAAKKGGHKTEAESLKITINGLFGKLGSRYSAVYSPDLMIQITLTGQLALLMLIEALDEEGIHVVSANTDGVFVRCRRDCVDKMTALVKEWELLTGFETEEARYDALYARDVNNYIAVKEDGIGTKLKGCYGPGLPLQKNPVTQICAEAVIDHLTLGASVEGTIRECRKVSKFVSVRNVTGGAEWRGEELGKVIRWYYATGVDEAILYSVNKHLVPKTYGAKPLMQLSDGLPADLDYAWYVNEANEMLRELAAYPERVDG